MGAGYLVPPALRYDFTSIRLSKGLAPASVSRVYMLGTQYKAHAEACALW